MEIEIYGASHIGCVRELNEDSFCTYGFENGEPSGFCILSDGMGGHNAGEVASQKTVQFMAEGLMTVLAAPDECVIPKVLKESVKTTNEKIFRMSQDNCNQRGMGATLVAAVFEKETVYIANVGDSRAYAIRNSEIKQITKDHSVVEEMVACGSITKEEARNHPQRNVITRAMGTDPNTKADIFEYNYMDGDKLLICSDGLSSLVADDEILRIVSQGKNAEETVKALIEKANDCGGYDNITVIYAEFIQEG